VRIYLAARYDRREELRAVAARLEAAGHEVTSVWIYGLREGVSDLAAAVEDIDGVAVADCVVSFTEEPTAHVAWAARGGRHVEFGLALAMGKRLCVVGPRENVFHHLQQVELYPTIAALIEAFSAPMEVAS